MWVPVAPYAAATRCSRSCTANTGTLTALNRGAELDNERLQLA
jgi:hypothetical protein